MKIISHRGNLKEKNPEKENSIEYILEAISAGFDVEIDVWFIDGLYWLGHDKPQYQISENFLKNDKLWCHAKNKEALKMMLSSNIHCFWHENDRFTLTSKGFIWCYPNNWSENGITVILDKPNKEILQKNILGICVDNPILWRSLL